MCGIIGYSGKVNGIPLILKGIKGLEYRGYDSFGIAFVDSNHLFVKKNAGKIDEIIEEFDMNSLKSNMGIAHTRWATHGKSIYKNAHPFMDCNENFAVVHNGIIENYMEIKKNLKGHKFKSETDSEVLVHMMEDYTREGLSLLQATKRILSEITGSSAFAFISLRDNKIIAAKNGSPLVFGIGKESFYISSDVPSLIDYTNRFIFMADGDIVQFSSKSYKIENVFKRVRHRIETINADGVRYEIGNFQHFMEKEIFDQFKIWESYKNLDLTIFEKVLVVLKEARRVYIIGSGSSYYASLYGAHIFRKAGLDALAIEPQELSDYVKILKKGDVFFIVSQSGETYDIISILKDLKDNAKIGLVNVMHSSLSRSVDIVIPMNAGTERAVAATKSMTTTVLTFIIVYSMLINDRTYKDIELLLNGRFNIYVPSVEKLVNRVSEMLSKTREIFIVARNEDYPLALEGALKLKEVSYINANAIDMATLKHGPLALITSESLVMAIVSPSNEKEASNNLEEIKSRGGYIIGISTNNMPEFSTYIRTVDAGIFYPLPIIFLFQLLSYKTAIRKGIDPDKPRNLAKSVTVK
ncbi:MAG: glutamine--fructose-6-phosphate transaminase (isomerizing) [Candidatus Thermoplasmatota archaeon]|jgi:glucosamine--fructose-6-phosphate aminotransferase (isomerizing)|nr:glutamine--fructose-6-phosphate transaminase (isomerizing) [Candidatus Thermoplasmatota archaeon]